MYETYFGLRDRPFQLSPDPNFFYASKTHSKGLAYLHYGIKKSEGFVVVSGIPGTGKTTLLNTLVSELPKNRFLVAKLSNTLLSSIDFLHAISRLFGLEIHSDSKVEILQALEHHLLQQARTGKHILLLIDEAHNLSVELLEELRLLSNFQFHDNYFIQFFLLGQEQLEEKINLPEMMQLRQRVLVSHQLQPINRNEIGDYVEHRLLASGWQGRPEFTRKALLLIHHYSDGIPRQINTLCDRVMLYTFMEEQLVITDETIEAVIEELRMEPASYVHGRTFSEIELSGDQPVSRKQGELDFDGSSLAANAISSQGEKDTVDDIALSMVSAYNNIVTWPTTDTRAGVINNLPSNNVHPLGVSNSLAEKLDDESLVNRYAEEDSEKVKELEVQQEELPANTIDEERREEAYEFGEEVIRQGSVNNKFTQIEHFFNKAVKHKLAIAGVMGLLFVVFIFTPTDDSQQVVAPKQIASVNETSPTKPSITVDAIKPVVAELPQKPSQEPQPEPQTVVTEDKTVVVVGDETTVVEVQSNEAKRKVDGITKVQKSEVESVAIRPVLKGQEIQTLNVKNNVQVKKPEQLIIEKKIVVKAQPKQKKQETPKPKKVIAEPKKALASKPKKAKKEVKEVAHKAISKKEPVQSNATVSSLESKALSIPTVEQLVIPQQELDGVLERFRDSYQAGNINEFSSLFSGNIKSNDVKNIKELKAEYKRLFDYTDARVFTIDNVKWEKEKDSAKGVGDFFLNVREKGANRDTLYKGKIELEIQRQKNDTQITRIYYSYNN